MLCKVHAEAFATHLVRASNSSWVWRYSVSKLDKIRKFQEIRGNVVLVFGEKHEKWSQNYKKSSEIDFSTFRHAQNVPRQCLNHKTDRNSILFEIRIFHFFWNFRYLGSGTQIPKIRWRKVVHELSPISWGVLLEILYFLQQGHGFCRTDRILRLSQS